MPSDKPLQKPGPESRSPPSLDPANETVKLRTAWRKANVRNTRYADIDVEYNSDDFFSRRFCKMHIYHRRHAEHMTEMRVTGMILCDVREMRKIISILAGAMNVANLVFANRFLSRHKYN